MSETAVFYFNHPSELAKQLNEWGSDHPGVEKVNYRHVISDDPKRGANIWMFDFQKIGGREISHTVSLD
jgi:hypothetical protein